jgi:hypothetical protein
MAELYALAGPSYGPCSTFNGELPVPEGDDVTVGIGVLCEGGDCAILATDLRVTYGRTKVTPHEKAGKLYSFPPFNFAGAIAGSPSSTHAIVSELSGQLRNLLKAWVIAREKKPEIQIQFEHVKNAIEFARKKELRRLQACAMESQLGTGLADWLAGKLPDGRQFNEYAHREGLRILKGVRTEMPFQCAFLLVGFLREHPLFFRGLGAEPIEETATPAIHVIGGQGARDAIQHLINRHQHVEMGVARTLLHVYEALKIARTDRGVGEPSPYMVMRPWSRPRPNGRLRFAADHPLLQQWSKEYVLRDTESLENTFANELANRAMVADISKPSQRLGPKSLQVEL